MPAYNKVMLMGHLTKDPELQYTPGGTAITTFTIAINRKWKGTDGEIKEEVDFIDCKAFTGIGETIANHLVKGNPIFVEGRITVERWENKEGEKKVEGAYRGGEILFYRSQSANTKERRG